MIVVPILSAELGTNAGTLEDLNLDGLLALCTELGFQNIPHKRVGEHINAHWSLGPEEVVQVELELSDRVHQIRKRPVKLLWTGDLAHLGRDSGVVPKAQLLE